MSTVAPWKIEKLTSTKGHVFNRPRAQAETTIIVFERGAYLGPLSANGNPALDAFKLARGHYEFWFVSTAQRPCLVNPLIPSQQAGFNFSVTIDLRYKVEDAKRVALNNPDNLDTVVENEVRSLLAHLHHKYLPDAGPQLEQSIRNTLEGHKRLESGTILTTWNLTVRSDKLIAQDGRLRYHNDLRVDQLTSQYKVDAQQAKLDYLLEMQQASQRKDLTDAKWDEIDMVVKRASIYLKQGQFDQLALLIADPNNPMTQQVVNRLERQRNQNTDRQWQMFQQWLTSDDTDRLAANMGTFFQGMNQIQSAISGVQPPALSAPQSKQLPDDIDDDEINHYDVDDDENP